MNTFKIFCISIILSLSTWITPTTASAQGVTVSFQKFYDELSPYGQWENDPDYGYVWSPYATGFSPYSTNGYWIYTDYGWTWVSNYSWGWAPFHYGRWNHRPGNRWVWVPDNVWGPAWVQWRNSPGYYGWAPMGYGNSNDYYTDYNRWHFVTYGNFGRHDIHKYYVQKTNNITIIKNSTIINNVGGPNVKEAHKHSGRTFSTVKVESNNKPGQSVTKDKLNIYRPKVDKNAAGVKPVPAKVISPSKTSQPKQIPTNNSGEIKKTQQQPKQNPGNNSGINKQPQQQPKLNPVNSSEIKKTQQQPKQNSGNNSGINKQPQQQTKQNPVNSSEIKQQQQQQQPRQNSKPENKGDEKPNK